MMRRTWGLAPALAVAVALMFPTAALADDPAPSDPPAAPPPSAPSPPTSDPSPSSPPAPPVTAPAQPPPAPDPYASPAPVSLPAPPIFKMTDLTPAQQDYILRYVNTPGRPGTLSLMYGPDGTLLAKPLGSGDDAWVPVDTIMADDPDVAGSPGFLHDGKPSSAANFSEQWLTWQAEGKTIDFGRAFARALPPPSAADATSGGGGV